MDSSYSVVESWIKVQHQKKNWSAIFNPLNLLTYQSIIAIQNSIWMI